MAALLPRLAAVLLVTLLVALASGCGFHLRGTGGGTALPDSWQAMHLQAASPNSEFTRVLRARFTASGIRWVDIGEATHRLELGPERFAQRNLSINAEARAAEFELTLRATFTVRDDRGALVMGPETAQVAKQMENDPRNVVGKAEEVRILRDEMRGELAQQIIRRIAFFAASSS
jgi:LPS-assembly lipoprotein